MEELYKKYRPKTFSEVRGNEEIVEALKEKIAADNLPHFIILAGPPGCGKTTISRIIKRKLGVRDLDFFEINAASANGVEVARSVGEKCLYKPLGKSKNRLWLFDEAHRLTAACFAAMLKILEDTPPHAYFIFASSEAQKFPAAIKSRATTFNLRPLNDSQMEELLRSICEKEQLNVPDKVIEKIIECSFGQSRNALVALDGVKDLPADKMMQAVEKNIEAESKSFELLKALLWPKSRTSWTEVANVLKTYEEDPEQTRRYLMTAACNRLKDATKNDHERCFQLAYSMRKPFYDNGMNDLVFACRDFFEAVNSK